MSTEPRLPEEVAKVDPRPFLSCHVYAPSGAEPSFYAAWPGRLGALEQISYRLKVEMEIEHWLRISLRLASPETRPAIGSIFRSEFGDLDEGGIARTLRILRGLEALLLGGSSFYRSIEESIKQENTAFARVVTLRGQAARIPAGFDDQPDWAISLPLLLIRAAVWSQTGRQQPYLWEAYSALRTSQAHQRPGWLMEPGRPFLTFLVRFQSAPGQYARKTGDVRFLKAARQIALGSGLDLKMVLTALGVLAVAQDFRNRKLDPQWKGAPIQGPREEERKLVCGHAYEHPRTNFEPFWALVDRQSAEPSEECQRASTWSYSRWLGSAEETSAEAVEKSSLSSAEVQRFQKLVEDSHLGDSQPAVAAYSFGRDYRSEEQKKRVIEAIKNVLSNPQTLTQAFTFNKIPVPDCLNDRSEEILMEIRLTDDFTAVDMVFRGLEPTKLDKQQNIAWSIYKMLFDTALKKDLIRWPTTTSEEENPRYCPTALVGRFLEVAHRLYPADCVSIPIRLNEDRSYFLHLPRVPPDADPECPEVQAAARYVPAWILNQIMMKDATRCHVALADLLESASGPFWKKVIDQEIEKNYFGILFHDYLSDYLAEPEPRQILLNQELLDLLPPLSQPSPDPGSEVHVLLQAIEAAGDRNPPVILGVNIGGTFIKMQFFYLERVLGSSPNAIRLNPVGNDFRVLTASKADIAEDKKLEDFVSRLGGRICAEAKLRELSPVADAIGVAWPGPVRRQRVQGTSGILAKLGFSRDIPINDINKIMEIDLARRLAKLIFGSESAARTVTLINDGNAHALGILADAFLERRGEGSADTELGVVVKAGTGTAGALIRNGLPRRGLMEFGKVLMNLAYQPGTKKYPEGVASDYCSSRTLPELIRSSLPRLENLNPRINSIEVGQLAEVDMELERKDQESSRDVLRRLVWDAGKIAIAGLFEKIAPEIDVVALEELGGDWSKGSDERRAKVAQYLALGVAGVEDASSPLQQRIYEYGELRVRSLLGFGTREDGAALKRLLDKNVANDEAVKATLERLRPTAAKAREAVRRLGIYIGDLLALLYMAHRMDYAILGGGVLSHVSGRLATEAAVEQLKFYNEIAAHPGERGGNIIIRFGGNKLSAGTEPSPERSSSQDPGTLGAALAGALDLLRQKRLDGLKRVIEIVHRLALMDALEITDTEVKEIHKGDTSVSGQTLKLQEYGLDAGRVRDYLDQAAPRLGLVRTRKYIYTRWLAEIAEGKPFPESDPYGQ